MNDKITIRPCTTLDEFEQCIALQHIVWGDSDRELVPQHIFVVAVKTGGQVFGAYDGDQLVGYLLSMVGLHEGRVCIHSHMAGVHPEYQNHGLGRRLKLAQREDAIARGIGMIEWTFDPLKVRNAYFNIVRLGAVIRTYLPNVYGQTSSHLDCGLPTDRFLAEWWINSPHVHHTLSGAPPTRMTEGERVFVPAENQTLEMQTNLRQTFQRLFAENYMVTGLARVPDGVEYLLEPVSAQYFSI